jgi:hypothetical protein
MKKRKQPKYYVAIDPANEVINDTINVFAVENGVTKMWDKIKLNSDYPLLVSNVFSFYDPEKAQEITERGKKLLEKFKKNGL